MSQWNSHNLPTEHSVSRTVPQAKIHWQSRQNRIEMMKMRVEAWLPTATWCTDTAGGMLRAPTNLAMVFAVSAATCIYHSFDL